MNIIRKIYLSALIVLATVSIVAGQVSFIEVTTLEEMEVAQKKASDQQLMMFVDV